MRFDGFEAMKGFEERLEPEMLAFKTGTVVMGKLESILAMSVKDKQTGALKAATRYVVEVGAPDFGSDGTVRGFTRGGGRVQFIGTHQVNSKLKPDDEGRFVAIACVGEDVTVRKGDNCMKVFDVRVWPGRFRWGSAVEMDSSPEITDSDIPF